MLLLLPALPMAAGTAIVAVAIALGGWFSARRVAETMSHRITPMNHGQGFAANLITSVIVIGASRWGLPVSTTHVSCGSLFGVGAATGAGHWPMITTILGAWLLTLPAAAALGAGSWWLLAGA